MAQQARRFDVAIAEERDTPSAPEESSCAVSSCDAERTVAVRPCMPPQNAHADSGLRQPIPPRDNDRPFSRELHEMLRQSVIWPHPLPIESPYQHAFAEQWVQTVKRERRDHFVVFGSLPRVHLMREFVDCYRRRRPDRGLGGRMIDRDDSSRTRRCGPIQPRARLGGHLIWHERRAA